MASTEHLLISKVIQTSSVSEVIDAGIRPYHLSGQWSEMLIWILNYWREYSAVPHVH